jgi:hypothetical protein
VRREGVVERRKGKKSLLFVGMALAVGWAVLGCGAATVSAPQASPSSTGDVWLFVSARSDSQIEAEIGGEDMESPIVASLDIEGNVASTIIEEVEEGPNREITITAYAPGGQSCSQMLTVEVRAGEIAKVESPSLACVEPSTHTARRGEPSEPISTILTLDQ